MSAQLIASLTALTFAAGALVLALYDHVSLGRRLYRTEKVLAEAKRMLLRRGQMASEVAHEIKNPLTAILCSAEALDLLIGHQLEDIHRRSLRYIKEYGTSLLQLISDYLDLNRAESGTTIIRPADIQLEPLVRSVVGLLEANVQRKRIKLTLVAQPQIVVRVDPVQCKQIVFNLLHNAIKFTPKDGEIHVSLHHDPVRSHAAFTVRDTGPGIAADLLRSILEPLARPQSYSGGIDLGSGLGLSLCRVLTTLNGGELRVQSSPGSGTVCEVVLPLAAAVQELPAQGAADNDLVGENSKPIQGQSVLVVDGDEGAGEAISKLIEAWGGITQRVTQLSQVMGVLNTRHFDVVLLDDALDGASGFDLGRMIKNDLGGTNTSVILVSSGGRSTAGNEAVTAQEAVFDSCISKPLNGDMLLKSLVLYNKQPMAH